MASPLLLLSSQVVTPCLNLPDVFIDYAAAFPAHLHNNITLASLPKTRPVGPFGTGVDASCISIKTLFIWCSKLTSSSSSLLPQVLSTELWLERHKRRFYHNLSSKLTNRHSWQDWEAQLAMEELFFWILATLILGPLKWYLGWYWTHFNFSRWSIDQWSEK